MASFLKDLRAANIAGNTEQDPTGLITWSYRGNELGGEVGEAMNVLKKLERSRLGLPGSRDTVDHLAQELADALICIDLIAMDFDIDLEREVRAKFNEVMVKRNLKARL